MTLITLQENTVEEILSLGENGRRAAGYGHTFLNKKTRSLAALRRRYYAAAQALGYSQRQAEEQWGDLKDYASLLRHV